MIYKDKQAEADYQMVVKWMGYTLEDDYKTPLHIKDSKGHWVVDGSRWDPKVDLNIWPSIYENMTDEEEDSITFLLDREWLKTDLGLNWFLITLPAETRYKALVAMLKERG